MSVCWSVCMFACMQHQQKSDESMVAPRTGVTGGYESPYGCWKPNLGLLQEK